MVAEVMGRYAGWIALHAGVAGGADAILIPEIPYDIELVAEPHHGPREVGRELLDRRRRRRRHPQGRQAAPDPGSARRQRRAPGRRCGRGVGRSSVSSPRRRRAASSSATCSAAARPTSFDRVLASRFGGKAVQLLIDGDVDKMVAFHPPAIVGVPLADIVGRTKNVPLDSDLAR